MTESTSSLPQVGLVGVSNYGSIHLGLILKAHERGLLEFSAAVIINPEEEADVVKELEQRSIRIYDAFETFITEEKGHLDLCFIPTGIHSHAPMTVAALHSGMNVLVEKPLAGSVEQVNWVIDTEKMTGRFVAVGFQDMYLKEASRLKKRLLEGVIGQVVSIRFMGLWPRPASYYSRNSWSGNLKADGVQALDSPLNNAFAHFVHLSLFLEGTKQESTASVQLIDAELIRAHAIESFDTGVIRAESSSGVQFWFGASHACSVQIEPILQIEGTEGRAMWYYDDRCEIIRGNSIVEEWSIPIAAEARWEMIKTVVNKLSDRAEPVSTAIVAHEHTSLIEATHKSTTIQPVDPTRIDKVPTDNGIEGDFIPSIRGLPEALQHAFEEGSTLAGTNLSLDQDT